MSADLLELLRDKDNGGVYVEFTKVDGTVRKMLCTLAETLIPEDTRPKVVEDTIIKAEDPAAPAPTTCRVYDLEKKAWRSFRLDSILSVTVWE